MKTPFYFARRYFLNNEKQTVINVISFIAIGGVAVGSLALIVVLSAFNGLEGIVENLYTSFDPEIRIEAKKGKTFPLDAIDYSAIKNIEGVLHTSRSLEESVLLMFRDRQANAVLKGVDRDFFEISELDSFMWEGEASLGTNQQPMILVGYSIARKLELYSEASYEWLKIYAPKRGVRVSVNPMEALNVDRLPPSGVFAISPDFDGKYALVPFNFAENFFQRIGEVTAIEIGLEPDANLDKIQEKIKKIVGNDFEVKNRYEMNELVYKTNKTEKWATFMILTLILVIAAFTIVGSITMMILDKKQDLFVLEGMGATRKMVRSVFVLQGLLISVSGGIIGLTVGGLLCLAQMHFGLVALPNAIVPYYPVELEALDFLAVFGIVLFIGWTTAFIPSRVMLRS